MKIVISDALPVIMLCCLAVGVTGGGLITGGEVVEVDIGVVGAVIGGAAFC